MLKRVVRWVGALGALGLIGLSAPPAVAMVVGNASYAGPAGGGGVVVFAVTRGGRRLVGMRVRDVRGTCPDGPTRLGSDAPTLPISSSGRFRGGYQGSVSLSVRGRVLPGGSARGTFSYFDRGDCRATGSFTARVERRSVGSGPLVFTLAGGDSSGPRPSPAATGIDIDAAGMAELPDGSILATDSPDSTANYVRRITLDGRQTVFAGQASSGTGGDGGPAVAAQLDYPQAVAVAADGSVLIADTANNCIRRVGTDGRIARVAGMCLPTYQGGGGFAGDGGPATAARLEAPYAVAALPDGGFLISDVSNERIRRVSATGTIITVTGNGVAAFSGDGGPATGAAVSHPGKILPVAGGGFLFEDEGNQRVRRVGPDGTITTVAGGGSATLAAGIGDGGPAGAALLLSPIGLSQFGDGFLVADAGLGRIRQVSAAGTINGRAGGGPLNGFGFPATDVQFDHPYSLLTTREGGIAIADVAAIRYIPPPNTHWLLLALRQPSVATRRHNSARMNAVTTAACQLTVTVWRRRATVLTVHAAGRQGITHLRFGSGLAPGSYRLRVTARSAGRITTASGYLRVR